MRRYLLIWLKGLAMGAADIVPGVSGGTVAFISGIYEELVDSLRRIGPAAFALWYRGGYRQGFKAFWQHINGSFLLVLVTGILTSMFTLAHLVHYALEQHAVLLKSFFCGLIIASIVYISRQLVLRSWPVCLALLVGTLIAAGIAQLPATQVPDHWWVMVLAGALAICAMILPGISGSFILLLIGVYPVFLRAITHLQWSLLLSFAVGCLVGLLAFSHLLSWLLRHFRPPTLGLLTGFLTGSLLLLWPWRYPPAAEETPALPENLSPGDYGQITGADPQLLLAVLAAVFGLVLVLGLEYLANRGGGVAVKERPLV